MMFLGALGSSLGGSFLEPRITYLTCFWLGRLRNVRLVALNLREISGMDLGLRGQNGDFRNSQVFT